MYIYVYIFIIPKTQLQPQNTPLVPILLSTNPSSGRPGLSACLGPPAPQNKNKNKHLSKRKLEDNFTFTILGVSGLGLGFCSE